MTAEIAILNKSGVALAADSAVTISAGSKQEKIFDSGDKLFELSHKEPIGVMIYNGMSFMEMPLATLVKQFRDTCDSFKTIEDAATQFLSYLNALGLKSPRSVLEEAVETVVNPVFKRIHDLHQEKFFDKLFRDGSKDTDINQLSVEVIQSIISRYQDFLSSKPPAKFVGKTRARVDEKSLSIIRKTVDEYFGEFKVGIRNSLIDIGKKLLTRQYFSQSKTGIVVAGFGRSEIFPTLIAYEIDGMLCGGLKYHRTEFQDIDRVDLRAAVLPFAQKEMVDRFLYGLDEEIRREVRKFCKESIGSISAEIFERVEVKNGNQKEILISKSKDAENIFLKKLEEVAFDSLKKKYMKEIEDIVEFMPKPELATMAEALVNLTKIKRRVSRGMETVGGPIDVAVISKTEGFVWVKRKHYFPSELNARYFERLTRTLQTGQEERKHGEK